MSGQKSSRLPSLDGWRALSILLVLGEHSAHVNGFPRGLTKVFHWGFDANLGVRTFFIISGFLITWLLLEEHERTGQVSLTHFYLRRGLRILPVYIAFICTLAALQYFTPFTQPVNLWLGNVTFTTNFVSSDRDWNTSGHLWSLAVEEQFYLLWPSIFVVLALAQSLRRALWILAIPIWFAPIARIITYFELAPAILRPFFSLFSFLNYFDSLAIGCICALLWMHRKNALRELTTRQPRIVFYGALALIIVPYCMGRLRIWGSITVPFGCSLQGLGIATLVMQSMISPEFGFSRFLNQDRKSVV